METKKGKTDIVKRKSKILGAAAVMAVTLVLGGFTVFAEESIFVNVTGKYGQTEAKAAKEPDSSDFEIDKNGVLVKYKGSGGDVIIPDGVKSIGERAFYGCSNLKSIKIPEKVESIGEWAFGFCSSLTGMELPKSMKSIGDKAFSSCSSLTSMELPENLKSIGEYAFGHCNSLTDIKLPKSVNSIGNIAFTDCPKLLSIEVASGNAKYYSVNGVLFDEEKDALLAYPVGKAEKTYQIPEGVKSIENSAFFGCSSLRSIELPESLSVIGDRTFVYCSSLTGIELPENVNSIGNIAFAGCDKLLSIEVASGNAKYYSVNGVLFDKEKDSLFAYPAGKAEKTYQIPEGVESIENSAFAYCSALTGIQIPEGVVSIGVCAFADCNNLKSIQIPEGVVSIGNGAFDCCISLTSIHIPASVESIGHSAFDRCEALIISCSKDSAAESYAKENNIPYQYITGESQTIKAKDITKTYGAKAFSLGAKASGGGKLTYTVSDKKVAAVSKTGRVTIKGCGVTKIKIKAAASKNHAAAAKTITLTVKPKQQRISSLKSQKAKALTVKWKKDAKATGYILQYSTDKKFKKAVKTVTIKKNSTTAKTVSKLNGGKKYYVRVCSYKTSGGKTVKGAYSPVKAVTVRR